MDSATVQLAELISTGEGDFTCPWYTTSLLDKIATLLDKRADINIAVCVYRTTSDPICRLLGSNPVIDSIFQRRSNGWCPADDASKFQHLGAPKLIATPLIDAADQDNREAITFFAQRGARIAPILERLSSNWISIDRLWGRFSFPGRDTRHQSIQKILDLADPKNAVVQCWVQEAFNAAVASGGDEDLALMLLRHGAQPTSRKLDSSKSSRAVLDMARLPAALSTSNPAFIRLVLLDNVDSCALVPRDESCRTARGPFGITPLIVAVGNASAAMCKFLLDSGANPNEYDDFGMTALMEAIHYGHEEAVNLLLAHGAETQKVEVRSIQSSPAASSYFRSDNQWNERVEYARICKKKGWHALHLAAYQGRSNTLRALCDAGAQVAALDDSGYSPLDVAMHNSQDMAAYYLLSRKCPFDSKSPAVSRLLTQAVTDCEHGVVGQLIESGVLLSPGFGLRGEHAEIEKLSKMKERSLNLLPTRVIGMDSLKDHEGITVDLCVDCSTQLTTAKFGSASKPIICCKFCQLLADCSHESTNHSVKVLYSMENGAKGDELVTVSPELTFRHPIKKVQDDWHTIFERLKHCNDTDTSSPAAMAMANSWLRRCIGGHRQCSYSRTSQYFPTRVLDLGGVYTGHRLKLLQNAALHEPYLALSHRWGSQGLPVTTLDNLASRLEGIDPAELSQIMRDAIQIVLGLGYRYLWIDALCIIQDSTDDWLSEASRMSSVFSGAVVTIAVADAENQSEGIFRKRPAQCMRPFYVPWLKAIPHRDRMHIDGVAKYYIFPKTNLVGRGTRTKGTLDTRGWVLQEQLLSTRILYYDKGEIYWDCITLSASESSPISASLLEVTNPDEIWALKLIRRTLVGSLDNITLRTRISDAWLEIIKNYSARVLTNQNDRLIALMGVIEPLKAILSEDHVAGMWRENLWLQLTWWTHASKSSDRTHGFPAPSWSWLSVQDRVYYHNSLLGEGPETGAVAHKFTDLRPFYFTIDHVESEELPGNTGNTGIIGTITVTAKCFPYRLTDKDLKKILYKRWNRSTLKLNTGRWMLDVPQELPLDIHCLIVAEDTVAKMLVCLCIVPDEENDGKWRRIGLCHWDGLAWQVPSFVGTEPEIRTFTLV